uniref:Uncharacterized protein n=1 Tax=Arundo donax TaxID=35708 RepID=A0A0A8XR07_ARUDO
MSMLYSIGSMAMEQRHGRTGPKIQSRRGAPAKKSLLPARLSRKPRSRTSTT